MPIQVCAGQVIAVQYCTDLPKWRTQYAVNFMSGSAHSREIRNPSTRIDLNYIQLIYEPQYNCTFTINLTIYSKLHAIMLDD